ncbi:MAG TPA: helix-turn-helix domain-containing protein [Puia sp.]|jgi:AraC-like DNA-binding protein
MSSILVRIKRLFEVNIVPHATPAGQSAPLDIGKELEQFMAENRPYLLNRYTIYQLSEDSGIDVSELGNYIYAQKKCSFGDFINRYRIQKCLELIKRIPPGKVSMSDLSIICGFPDEHTFSLSFKKVTGSTVSDYLHKLHLFGRP